jgi:hypothetical protein
VSKSGMPYASRGEPLDRVRDRKNTGAPVAGGSDWAESTTSVARNGGMSRRRGELGHNPMSRPIDLAARTEWTRCLVAISPRSETGAEDVGGMERGHTDGAAADWDVSDGGMRPEQ